MTPTTKRRLIVTTSSIMGLIATLIVAGIFVAQTEWFREFVRQKIIQTVESATGGRVEIGNFQFDWKSLRVDIDRFVLHGTERPPEDPLFNAKKLTVELRLLSVFRQRKVDISSVAVDEPHVNFIVFPDGQTNVPNPAVKNPSDKSALQTIVDLAIGRFTLSNGYAKVNQQKIPFSLQGQDLRAGLVYETLQQRYSGQLSTNPLYLQYANGKRLDVAVNLPVIVEADKIQLNGATLKTPLSSLNLTGALENLTAPKISVKANGQIDIPEVAATLAQTFNPPSGAPRLVDLNLDATSDNGQLQIASMKASWGQSNIAASGSFRNLALEDGSLDVTAHAAVDEIAGLLQSSGVRAGGALDLQGLARIRTLSDYTVDASLTGQNLSFQSGATRIDNVRLSSTLMVDPLKIVVNPIHMEAIGGTLDGRAELANLDRYQFSANLNRFQLQDVMAIAGARSSAWGANISGPIRAEGSLKNAPLEIAQGNLRLTPGGRGIPVSGQLNVAYKGVSDAIDVGQSFLALPSSRLEFAGALNNSPSNNRLTARLTSQNLNDFLPALNMASATPVNELPVSLEAGGLAALDATLTGKLSSPVIAGHIRVSRFQVEMRRFDLLNADLNGASNSFILSNGTLTRGQLQAQMAASIGLDGWKVTANQPLSANVKMQNADVLDLLALAGQKDIPVSGQLTLNAQVAGTAGAPQGTASLSIVKGSAYGEPLDKVDGQVSIAGQRVTLSSLQIDSNMASLNLSATFDHPPDSYTSGSLRGHIEGNQVALSRIATIQKQRPGIDGDVQLNMDLEALLQPDPADPRVELLSANGTLGVRGLKYGGDDLGDTQARIQTSGKTVGFNITSNLAGSSLQADGHTTLAPNFPTEANLDLQNLRIERILKLAGVEPADTKGLLSAQGTVSGTLQTPQGNLDLTLTQAQYAGQPIDRLQTHVDYAETSIDIPSLSLQAGPNQLTATASFKHPAGDFERGDIKVNAKSNSLQLAQLTYVKEHRPGLAGIVEAAIDAAGSFDQDRSRNPVVLSSLSASVNGRSLQWNGRDYGAFSLAADQRGSLVNFKMESNVAQSAVQGNGQIGMTPDYPVTADVTIQNVRYSNWAGLLAANPNDLQASDFDALLEGKINLAGPLLQPTKLTGTAEFPKIELYTLSRNALVSPGTEVALRNDGPVTLAATAGAIEIRRARWLGPSTDVSVTGKATLEPQQSLDLTIKANANLALLHDFDRNVRSEGAVVLDATVKGSPQNPAIAGRMELKDAAYQASGMLNGLSHANGVVILSGTAARIETLKGEVGGGDVTLTGGVTRSANVIRFDLSGRVRTVRILTAAGASVVANANVKLSGTSENSLLSGDVNVRAVAFNSRTDFGSILSKASPPKETPGGEKGFLDRMRLNINIGMGTTTTFRTTFAEGLQATADLTVRGTAGSPGMLGRIQITQGELLFFGTKYSVHEGTVSFYNPAKIEPTLNLNLATTARGVDVVLVVTGPIQNMNLAYQSDPPLQFSEIVALLAAGKLPTSDPVLLAHQPATPSQTLPQMGASALVGAAVANPIAGRLQRVFGVSQLKIDPTFTSGSELPQARLTLQQQITSELTFTYVTNLTRADPQIVRVEWAVDTDWSAILTRQENGSVGMDLFYKRRFQ